MEQRIAPSGPSKASRILLYLPLLASLVFYTLVFIVFGKAYDRTVSEQGIALSTISRLALEASRIARSIPGLALLSVLALSSLGVLLAPREKVKDFEWIVVGLAILVFLVSVASMYGILNGYLGLHEAAGRD